MMRMGDRPAYQCFDLFPVVSLRHSRRTTAGDPGTRRRGTLGWLGPTRSVGRSAPTTARPCAYRVGSHAERAAHRGVVLLLLFLRILVVVVIGTLIVLLRRYMTR
jgi:hypothetical protein